ncbi:MAG: hypothetical protein M3472_08160 [Chloroflexota bacterium]|nr:hypothetical protein [Chloroflexota bacterium]
MTQDGDFALAAELFDLASVKHLRDTEIALLSVRIDLVVSQHHALLN